MSSGAAATFTSSIRRIRIGKRGKADGTAEIPDLTVAHPIAPSQLEGESPTVGHGDHAGRRSRPGSPESGRSRTERVYETLASRVSCVGNVLTNWISLKPRFASGSPSRGGECHEQTPTSQTLAELPIGIAEPAASRHTSIFLERCRSLYGTPQKTTRKDRPLKQSTPRN